MMIGDDDDDDDDDDDVLLFSVIFFFFFFFVFFAGCGAGVVFFSLVKNYTQCKSKYEGVKHKQSIALLSPVFVSLTKRLIICLQWN